MGTGLEGCWLAWRVSEIGLAQRKEDECFSLSEVTLGRGRNAVASPDGPTRTIFTTNALPLLDLGPGIPTCLEVPASTLSREARPWGGRVLLVSLIQREREWKDLGRGHSAFRSTFRAVHVLPGQAT